VRITVGSRVPGRKDKKRENNKNNIIIKNIIIIIIIIIIILVISFMQGIYNFVPETNNISGVCSVAAVLLLQFVPHVTLFRP
jgi:protein-S-isoprenylcysteine O-methyltransferase Ste14